MRLQMRQLEPQLDPSAARELAQGLLEEAQAGVDPGELASVSPEEAADRYASGWSGGALGMSAPPRIPVPQADPARGCERKNRTISADASGPLASV